jgi:hypothetical protein
MRHLLPIGPSVTAPCSRGSVSGRAKFPPHLLGVLDLMFGLGDLFDHLVGFSPRD